MILSRSSSNGKSGPSKSTRALRAWERLSHRAAMKTEVSAAGGILIDVSLFPIIEPVVRLQRRHVWMECELALDQAWVKSSHPTSTLLDNSGSFLWVVARRYERKKTPVF